MVKMVHFTGGGIGVQDIASEVQCIACGVHFIASDESGVETLLQRFGVLPVVFTLCSQSSQDSKHCFGGLVYCLWRFYTVSGDQCVLQKGSGSIQRIAQFTEG